VHERRTRGALKATARELGVSEAEPVRRMLYCLLLDGAGGRTLLLGSVLTVAVSPGGEVTIEEA
jgi:hypothetical protein